MATLNKDGSVQLTMEEFQQMQSGKSGGNGPDDGEGKGSWFDKWKGKMTKKAEPNKGGQNPNPNPNQNQLPNGKNGPLTREALMEAAKKLNFFEPTTEQLKRIQEGDMSAFMEAQQDAMRRLFVDSTMTSNSLVDMSQTNSRQEFDRMIQESLGRMESAKTIRDKTVDFFQAPGGDLMVSALTRQFKEANPDSSAAEIGDMVSGYLSDFSQHFGQKETTPNAREVQLQQAQESATDF